MSLESRASAVLVTINEIELLHAGVGVLMAHYLASEEPVRTRCLALTISRQLRLISEHPDLPDWGLRPLYRTMAARWHVRASPLEPDRYRFGGSHERPDKEEIQETRDDR